MHMPPVLFKVGVFLLHKKNDKKFAGNNRKKTNKYCGAQSGKEDLKLTPAGHTEGKRSRKKNSLSNLIK